MCVKNYNGRRVASSAQRVSGGGLRSRLRMPLWGAPSAPSRGALASSCCCRASPRFTRRHRQHGGFIKHLAALGRPTLTDSHPVVVRPCESPAPLCPCPPPPRPPLLPKSYGAGCGVDPVGNPFLSPVGGLAVRSKELFQASRWALPALVVSSSSACGIGLGGGRVPTSFHPPLPPVHLNGGAGRLSLSLRPEEVDALQRPGGANLGPVSDPMRLRACEKVRQPSASPV